MAFSTTIQHVEKPVTPVSKTPNNDLADALFGMVMLSVYGAQMSKKTLRKMKRQFFWTSLKLKFKSFFQPKEKRQVSDRTLIYILLGVALIALIVLAPVAALILAILALILILAGVI